MSCKYGVIASVFSYFSLTAAVINHIAIRTDNCVVLLEEASLLVHIRKWVLIEGFNYTLITNLMH